MISLSASRIKTFTSCSALYWAKYIKKLPDPSNAGAAVGSAVHDLCEIVFAREKKYCDIVNEIISSRKLPTHFYKYLCKHLKKSGFLSIENVEKAARFSVVAFSNDFWIAGAVVRKRPEEEFLIGDTFKLKGFIDKYALFKDDTGDWYCKVIDYKSQKERFTEEEMSFNVQALSYLLSVKTAHPEINLLKSSVQFILLAYPEDPIQVFKITRNSQIDGFQAYLESMQESIDSFGDANKCDNLAARQEYPKEGFKGPIMCGRAKEKGQLKKDGTKMWHCVYKFPFYYYVLLNDKNEVVKSSFEPIKSTLSNSKVEKRYFAGCPAFNR